MLAKDSVARERELVNTTRKLHGSPLAKPITRRLRGKTSTSDIEAMKTKKPKTAETTGDASGLLFELNSSSSKRKDDDVATACDDPANKRTRSTPSSQAEGDKAAQTSCLLATYVWICFVCLFKLGLLTDRRGNDGKYLSAVCGDCPHGDLSAWSRQAWRSTSTKHAVRNR